MVRISALTAGLGAALALAAGTAAPVASAQTGAEGISSDLMRPSARPVRLSEAIRPLDVTYTYNGSTHTLQDYLTRSSTKGFVVLDGQKIVSERYAGAARNTRFQSWSMAKSFTSAAVGIALSERRIHSIDDPVTRYLPELRRSGYNGVSIRDLLRMSSGIAWNEDLDAPLLQVAALLGQRLTALAARQVRGWAPGGKFDYTSMNYFVLAWLVDRVTGVPYYRYVETKIWRPAGMESAAHIANDTHGNNLGYCCYYATDRDFARFGLLFLRHGTANGMQVVPRTWVGSSTRPSSSRAADYGLGWWLGGGNQHDFMATGFGGQYIYVSPEHGVVIVDSTDKVLGARQMQQESLILFRAIAATVAATRRTLS
jgi:CubicO group peptidase (beta-lactamase class C family)